MFLFLWLLLHGVLAAAGTWLARRYALRRQLLDQPGERRSHSVATPRGGGVAIVIVMLLSMGWLAAVWPAQWVLLGCLAAGLVLVAGIGWMDDHRAMSPWPRLLVHVVASALLGWGIYRATGSFVFSVQAFVTAMLLTNIWNFMDGIDGLAASQAAIVALALGLALGGAWLLLAMGLVAAAAGFLPFNFPRARIFLGDVGSGALGFLLAGLLSVAMIHTPSVWPLLWLPLAAFLVDALFTLAMRILRREKWWAPHVQHTYQRWASRDGGHVKVTFAYAGFSLVGLLLMQLGLVWTPAGAAWICLVWYVAAMLLWARMRRDVYINKDARQ
jgi:UDP-N-acetylmuramyl pentapeptide phosphotransferase/UDP-N-acetylglucosamine-1-phosphate transferase